MNAKENGAIVMERVKHAFYKRYPRSSVVIRYRVSSLDKVDELSLIHISTERCSLRYSSAYWLLCSIRAAKPQRIQFLTGAKRMKARA